MLVGMANFTPMFLAALGTALAVGLCWLRLQERRERGSAEWQRERLRREYWGQV
jgi:hypothetical protein